jgi:predicted permease
MRNLVRDLALALRHWRRAPALAIVAILVMALGASGALALFGVLDVLVLRPLAVPRPGDLVEISARDPRAGSLFGVPIAAIDHLVARQHSFQALAGFTGITFVTGDTRGWTDLTAVTGSYFDVLGLAPAMGRLIAPDDVAQSAHVVVVGYDYWQRALHADPHVIGRAIAIQRVPFTVVGVMPKTFHGLEIGRPSDVVIPIGLFPAIAQVPADEPQLVAIGRLRAGTPLAQAHAEMQALWPGMLAASVSSTWPDGVRLTYRTLRVDTSSARTGVSGSFRDLYSRPLFLLALAGLVVLALACMNVSTLLLARSAAHEHELGIRAALGASRGALARQVLVECLLMSTLGTLAGIPIAAWSARRLLSTMMWWASPGSLPIDLTPDVRVTLVVLACAIVAGVLFGALPAYRATHPGLIGAVRSTWAPPARTLRWGRYLLIAQIALATVLFVATLLVAVNLQRLVARPDVPRAPAWVAGLDAQPGAYSQEPGTIRAYYQRLVDALTADGAFESACLAYEMPYDVYGGQTDPSTDRFTIAPVGASSNVQTGANRLSVTPGLFRTLGLPAPIGRDFRWNDDATHAQVAIVSGAVARALFGQASAAVGRHIRIGDAVDMADVEIVGVTGDTPLIDLREQHPFYVLRPLSQASRALPSPFVLVRSRRDAAVVDRDVARRVDALGYDHVVVTRSLTAHIDAALLRERLMTAASTYFAVLAGTLLTVGIAGMMAYHVARRTREIGIRSALGASSRGLQMLILRESLFIVLVGLAIGLPAAWMASGLLRSSIAGLSVHAPFAFAGAAAMAISIGVLAAWLPARRAAAISPLVALRSE